MRFERLALPALPSRQSDDALTRYRRDAGTRRQRRPGDTAPISFSKNGTCVYRGHGTHPLPPFLASNDWVPRLFNAAERCIDGYHAGNVLCGVLFHILGYDDAAEFETEAAVRRMTAGWSDEHKRDELVAVFRRVEHQRKAEDRGREGLGRDSANG